MRSTFKYNWGDPPARSKSWTFICESFQFYKATITCNCWEYNLSLFLIPLYLFCIQISEWYWPKLLYYSDLLALEEEERHIFFSSLLVSVQSWSSVPTLGYFSPLHATLVWKASIKPIRIWQLLCWCLLDNLSNLSCCYSTISSMYSWGGDWLLHHIMEQWHSWFNKILGIWILCCFMIKSSVFWVSQRIQFSKIETITTFKSCFS